MDGEITFKDDYPTPLIYEESIIIAPNEEIQRTS